MLELDGGHGEGGGQIVRTACALAALTGKPIRITAIRANRKQPGLKPQHVTAVRAAARLCGADLRGDALGSLNLLFYPHHAPEHGEYMFDVNTETDMTSAGSVILIAQTLIPALIVTPGRSRIILRGGTDMPFSPPFFYFSEVYLPVLRSMGARIEATITRHGFYPVGGGEIVLDIEGVERLRLPDLTKSAMVERVEGIIYNNDLPEYIPQRVEERARELLSILRVPVSFTRREAPAPSPGVGIVLVVHTNVHRAGFTGLGRRGWPAESVAEQATEACLNYLRRGGFWEPHLSDQMVVPLMLTGVASRTTVSVVTQHLLTNIWVANHFLKVKAVVEGKEGERGVLFIKPESAEGAQRV